MDPLNPHDAPSPLNASDAPNAHDSHDSQPPLTRRPLLALTLIVAGLGLWLNYSIQASEPSASTVAGAQATATAIAVAFFTDFFPVPTDIASDAYAPSGSLPTAPAYILSNPPGTPVAGGGAASAGLALTMVTRDAAGSTASSMWL